MAMISLRLAETAPESTQSSGAAGVAWAVLAVALFSLIFIAGKLTGGELSAFQIVWFRYFGGLIAIVAVILARRQRLATLISRQPQTHVLRAATGGGGAMAGIYAATHLPMANATALGLFDGVLTIALAALLLRERVRLGQWAAAALCMGGAYLVVRADGSLVLDPALTQPMLVALLGACLIAAENLYIKTLSRSEDACLTLLYVNAFATLMFSIPAFLSWTAVPWAVFGGLLLLGPIAVAGQFCNIAACRRVDVSIVGAVRYSWIVFASLLGALVLGESLGALKLAGIAVILGAGVWLSVQTRRRNRRAALVATTPCAERGTIAPKGAVVATVEDEDQTTLDSDLTGRLVAQSWREASLRTGRF